MSNDISGKKNMLDIDELADLLIDELNDIDIDLITNIEPTDEGDDLLIEDRFIDREGLDNSLANGNVIKPLRRFPRNIIKRKVVNRSTLSSNRPFVQMLGKEVLLTLDADQLNLLGQTFRPIFCGKVMVVSNGYITLSPVIIKMPNAPFHQNPTPLSFPINSITTFVPFSCKESFPIH